MRKPKGLLLAGAAASALLIAVGIGAQARHREKDLAGALAPHVVKDSFQYFDRSTVSAGPGSKYKLERELQLKGVTIHEVTQRLERLCRPSEGWTWRHATEGAWIVKDDGRGDEHRILCRLVPQLSGERQVFVTEVRTVSRWAMEAGRMLRGAKVVTVQRIDEFER